MKDPELEILISELESRNGLSVAELDGVAHGLVFLLPKTIKSEDLHVDKLDSSDEAMLVADRAFPNWAVHIRGRANDKDGHWHCTLRESDVRDNDSVIGTGRSPILGQAILAAVMQLAMKMKA